MKPTFCTICNAILVGVILFLVALNTTGFVRYVQQ